MLPLSPSWNKLRYHKTQQAFLSSPARIIVVAAGRRSGKTAIAKRKSIIRSLSTYVLNARHCYAAPTYSQAKRIFWQPLKAMLPAPLVSRVLEGELAIHLHNSAEHFVTGMDMPERVEGSPLDHIVLDEYANMHPTVWPEHVRPALYTEGRPPGRALLIGVPEGRNHFFDIFEYAQDRQVSGDPEYAAYSWSSEDILPPEELASARASLDTLTYAQEYLASFVSFQGRAYYPFSRSLHAARRLFLDPTKDIILCFDFNVDPGVACIVQEQEGATTAGTTGGSCSCAIQEVYILKSSNTARVCERLIALLEPALSPIPLAEQGDIYFYGDATGGSAGSAKIAGSDWDIIRKIFAARGFSQDRLHFRYPKQNPRQRVRINAMNSRLLSADGSIHFLVDPVNCPHLIKDFEGVTVIEGTSGEIDKNADPRLSHISDSVSYYVAEKYPITGHSIISRAYA